MLMALPLDQISSWLLYSLATWRIVHLLQQEEGPFGVFEKFRLALGTEDDTYKYKITVCHACLSVWIAVVVILLPWQVSLVFAISAVSMWVENKW